MTDKFKLDPAKVEAFCRDLNALCRLHGITLYQQYEDISIVSIAEADWRRGQDDFEVRWEEGPKLHTKGLMPHD